MSRTLEAVTKKSTPIPHITKDELRRLHERREQLLPVEAQAKAQINTQISIGKVALRYPEAKILDKSVLRWRWPLHSLGATIFKVPLPKLALINISSPQFFLRRLEGSRQETSIMPSGVPGECYGDIFRPLDWSTAFVKSSTLSFIWHGLIPETSVQTINEAEEFFGHYDRSNYRDGDPRVYLLTEAPHNLWSMESEAKEPRRVIDPLIVGHRDDHLFVVGSFDPTPLEQYVASEFTT